MRAHTPFPPILLDDGHADNLSTSDNPAAARIWNIFCGEDFDGFSFESGARPPILRIYDLSLIERLASEGHDESPLIISHLIDLTDTELPHWPAGLAIEVANRAGIVQANSLQCDLVIGRSFEVPGPSRECSAFLLFQLLSSESRHPFYLHGNTGYDLFQAYLAMGVSGIVLPEDQFRQDQGVETFRFPLDGGVSLRLCVKGGAPEAVAIRERVQSAGKAMLAESFAAGMWCSRSDDLLSSENRPRLDEYVHIADVSPRSPVPGDCFYPNSSAARQLRCPLPIVQGAMANVSRRPAFAKAVFEAGGFPVLALAGLPVDYACGLMRETAALDIPFGAGIVSVSEDDAALELLIECLEETNPTLVVLAAPQLDHVQRLLQTDLNLAVHAPNGAMFRVLFDMGVRTFVIEGEEAGGHVSRIGGLSAWQEVLHEIRQRNVQHEVHIILAGGIKSSASARLISQLVIFSGMAKELKVSLQMGTAYLGTFEALELTPMPAVYQQLLFKMEDTIVTGETLHRNVRQLATPATADLLEQEWSIFTAELGLVEKKQAYEQLYQGAHQRAISCHEQDPSASYMAGGVAALIDKPVSIHALHQELIVDARPDAGTFQDEPIAIVGVGIQIPGAEELDEHFRNLLLKRCFIRDIPDRDVKRSDFLTTDPDDHSRSYSGLAGLREKQDVDLSMFNIPPIVANELSSFQIVSLKAAHRALTDAGFFLRPFPGSRVSTFVGVNSNTSQPPTDSMIRWKRIRERLLELPEVDEDQAGILQGLFDEYESLYSDEWEYSEDTCTGQLSSIVASRIANIFNLGGLTNTLDAACASGLAALAHGVSMLREGRCDVALTGAVGPELAPDIFVSFASLHALSAEGSFPFDSRADGFVIGEGGGMFVLKRESDALLHGDRIYALIHDWGASSDGAGKGITAPNYRGQMRALEEAYTSCDIKPDDLDFLECHATGTPVGDKEERLAVHAFFGDSRVKQGKPLLPIGGSKAMTGHLLTGAGVVSTLSALLAINLRRVPPQVNFEQPPEDIDLQSLGLKVATRPELIHSEQVRAAVSSFGFGGVNYHMVLSTPGQNARPPLLDPSIADFPLFEDLSSDTMFLFSGQGAQHPGMLHAYRDDPAARDLVSHAAGIFKQYDDAPLEDLLFVDPALDDDELEPFRDMLKATRVSQPAIFMCSAVLLEKLHDKGITPALVSGHSLGEHTALYASGMMEFDDAFRTVCLRGQLMSNGEEGDPGAMAALACSDKEARELLDGLDAYATCANFNSYHQTVVSGETEAVLAVMERAESRHIRAHRLPVERGFHSQLVADCEAPMIDALSEFEWRNGTVPVLANVSRRAYPRSDASRAGKVMSEQDKSESISLLAGLIPSPVDFISQVNAAYESGIRRFVEVGPKNILTRLVDQILQGKPFQTEALFHITEQVTDRIEVLGERLRQPLKIKREPLPRAQTVRKTKRSQASIEPVSSTPLEVVRTTVAEVSGYELDQIADDAEFERDLGIDTLKIFEILSRLRGSILPQQVENFRQLTSVEKILAAADTGSESSGTLDHQAGKEDAESLHCYQYRTSIIGSLSESPAETSEPIEPGRILIVESLPVNMAVISRELLPRLHRLLREHASEDDGSRPSVIDLVTYAAADEFYDGAHMALTAFLRSAQKDIPSIRFSYTHFDGERPGSDAIAAALREPRIGCHVKTDGRILSGSLHHIRKLVGERDRLAELISETDVVLVTGGARGITAEVTRSLIQRTGARFLIVARQARVEPWIAALPQERISYFAADLLDEEAIAKLELAKYGITLVIHGAGIEVSQNLVSKTEEEFSRVLGIKVGGLERILEQLDPNRLRGVVQFSSVVSYVGNNGQADYAAANGILNGTLPMSIPALSIAWDAWGGVGMATRGMVREIFETQGVKTIPLDKGVEVFERLLAGFLSSPPCGTTRTAVFAANRGLESGLEDLLPSPPPLPLSQYRLSDPDAVLDLEVKVDLEKHSILKDHQFDGNVVTPACIMLRQFAVTAMKESTVPRSNQVVLFRDTDFLTPLLLEQEKATRLQLTRYADTFVIDRLQDDGHLPVMRTRMQLLEIDDSILEEASRGVRTISELAELRSTPFDTEVIPISDENGLCAFGPAFDVLDDITFNGLVICGRVDLEKADADRTTLLADNGRLAYMIESAFLGAMRWFYINVRDERIRLPRSMGSCMVFPERCAEARSATVLVNVLEKNPTRYFDCVVVDENNLPLLVMTDLEPGVPDSVPKFVRRHPVRSTPVLLGEAEVLVLDLVQAVAWGKAHSCLTPDEESEIEILNSVKRKDERLAGKVAAKLLARNSLGPSGSFETEELLRYQVFSEDKPVELTLDGKALADRACFSISHTDDVVCVARAGASVGIDVERIRSLPDKTIEDICGEHLMQKMRDFQQQVKYVSADHDVLRHTLPVLIFTQKEAVLKAAGIGLAEGLDDVILDEVAVNREFKAYHHGITYKVFSIFDSYHVVSVAIAEQAQPVINVIDETINQVPVSSLQASLCQSEMQRVDGRSYSLTHRLELRGPVDKTLLIQALEILDRQNEVLRMGFAMNGDGHIRPSDGVDITQVSLNHLAADEAEKSAERHAQAFAGHHYKLSSEPLYRVLLIELPGDRHLLLINFHHLVMDCFTSFEYSNALIRAYYLLEKGEDPEKEGMSSQYMAFIERQHARSTPEREAKLLQYWANKLKGTEPVYLPKTTTDDTGVSHSEFRIRGEVTLQIETYCRGVGVTTFIGLLTALQFVFLEWLRRRDMFIAIPFSLKEPHAEAGMLGPFVNLLPLRASVSEQTSWKDLSKSLRSDLFDAIDHADISPDTLAKVCAYGFKDGQPPASIICQLIYAPEGDEPMTELEIQRSVVDGHDELQALVFSFFIEPSGLRCAVTRNTALVDQDSLDRLLERFLEIIVDMCASPESSVLSGQDEDTVNIA